MKTILLTFVLSTALLVAANAENPNFPEPPQRSIPTGTARDGFFIRESKVYMVRNGVTTLVEREMVFPNGVRVQPNRTVTLRDGREVELLRNQWLTFQGSLEDFSAPPASPPANTAASRESGISSRDGITISGADVFITRNGVTDKVIADVHLPNGVIAKTDGTILFGDGKKVTLRSDQVLDLNGILHDAPVARPAPGGTIAPSTNPPR